MGHPGADPAADADLGSADQVDAAAHKPELISRLVRRRAARGLSQADVAKRMGTSQPAVARLESGRHDAQLSTVSRYAEVLGLSLVLAENGEPSADSSGAASEGEGAEPPPSGHPPREQLPPGVPPIGSGPRRRAGRKPQGGGPLAVAEMPDGPDPGQVLTARQRQVLQVISDSVQHRGYPPSMREIGDAVGLTSASSVAYQLSTLQRKGYLRRDAGRARTVEVRLPEHPVGRPEDGTGQEPIMGLRSPETVHVPVLSHLTAGGLTPADQGVEDVFSLPREIVGEGSLFLLQVADDSMSGAEIWGGDWVVVRRHPEADEGDIVAAMVGDRPAVRVYRRSDDHVWLMPYDPSYREILGDQARILGQVVALVRRF